MAVRNFYLEAEIDGRKTDLHGGPQNKKGGMKVELYQRNKGEILHVATITCRERDGVLISNIHHKDSSITLEQRTERD